jgi:hypothetical protein
MRCDRILPCGHQCPSLCGEPCPPVKFCRTCARDDVLNMMVDIYEGKTYKEFYYSVKEERDLRLGVGSAGSQSKTRLDDMPIIVLACGHI